MSVVGYVIKKDLSAMGRFFMFAVIGAAALIFVITQVPETRGITLEQLEEDVTSGRAYTFSKNPFARA